MNKDSIITDHLPPFREPEAFVSGFFFISFYALNDGFTD